MANCPKCGAPIKGYQCEYCGTVFDKYIDTALEAKLLKAKNMAIDNSLTIERLYNDALNAMRLYGSYY